MSSAVTMVAAPMTESRIPSSRVLGGSRRPLMGLSFQQQVYSRHIPSLRNRLHGACEYPKTRYFYRAINLAGGQSDDPQKLDIDGFVDTLRKLWDGFPQPVRSFPWTKAVKSYFQLIFELTWAVVRFLSIPVLAVSSLSEMSYCAHERKMIVIPVPLISGIVVAGVLEDTVRELSPDLKKTEFPGHLLLIACFFLLLKLPGPYYPYWGRLVIPHFANGGLWRTAWSAFMWYRKPQETAGKEMGDSVGDNPYKDEK